MILDSGTLADGTEVGLCDAWDGNGAPLPKNTFRVNTLTGKCERYVVTSERTFAPSPSGTSIHRTTFTAVLPITIKRFSESEPILRRTSSVVIPGNLQDRSNA